MKVTPSEATAYIKMQMQLSGFQTKGTDSSISDAFHGLTKEYGDSDELALVIYEYIPDFLEAMFDMAKKDTDRNAVIRTMLHAYGDFFYRSGAYAGSKEHEEVTDRGPYPDPVRVYNATTSIRQLPGDTPEGVIIRMIQSFTGLNDKESKEYMNGVVAVAEEMMKSCAGDLGMLTKEQFVPMISMIVGAWIFGSDSGVRWAMGRL